MKAITDEELARLKGEAARGEPNADWRKAFAHRTVFDLDHVAMILSGGTPCSVGGDTKGSVKDCDTWMSRLKNDIHELLAPSGLHSNWHFHQVSHAKVREWCKRNGIEWPIPPSPWGDTCGEAKAAAADSETEQLRKHIAKLEAQVEQQAQRITEFEAEAERTIATGGLMFPYATPELLAMQEAALKHWAGYNAETDRKPLQKEIGLELTEALALNGSSGQPSRQAAVLASAIQPEKYRG
ncbi:hypothetical protein [Thiopseudomonas denitrificans]|uniref:Uncharacterized protein n=1 Tax=Thiopseudomonas denitrificans TaxID=1501432 RepID=A0A4R6TZ06_9GAMM|nr:hypothetical protein [Thiopseudomonas denitrificans]TDQ37563.1 hypothetical protein DFQ45_10768 [Thiopseudomonas denitrificans]